MKMYYGNVPIKSMNIKHYEMDTNDATLNASDLQAGITAYARGRKVTGTGKAFEFASYGSSSTNMPDYIPTPINVVEITSLEYPVKSLISFNNIQNTDFTIEQTICVAVVDNIEYPIVLRYDGTFLTFVCEKTIALEVFYGKDNYI